MAKDKRQELSFPPLGSTPPQHDNFEVEVTNEIVRRLGGRDMEQVGVFLDNVYNRCHSFFPQGKAEDSD